MNVTAKIFFNNTTTYIENDFLKIKKMIIIKDLLLLPNVKNPKHLLNKYKFEDKSVDKIYKKYTMKHEEWLELLNGVVVLRGDAVAISVDTEKNSVTSKVQTLTAIPYYAWAHRGKGEMTVWLPQKISAIEILSR